MPMIPHPTSFGVFKPINHVVMSFKTTSQMKLAQHTVFDAQFDSEQVYDYTSQEMQTQSEQDLDQATTLAGIGQDLNLVKEHLALAKLGYCFLVVFAPEKEQIEKLTQIATACGAIRAQNYGRFIVEELIPQSEGSPQRPESLETGLDS